MMVGRELSGHYFPPRHAPPDGEIVLQVTDLVVPGRADPRQRFRPGEARFSASPDSSAPDGRS